MMKVEKMESENSGKAFLISLIGSILIDAGKESKDKIF